MATKVYGLIGYPLVHSSSRGYFNHKFAAEGIDARYENFEIEDVGQLMEILAEQPTLSGLNVTTPYKEAVIPYLQSLDESAAAVGAVNVIEIQRDKRGEVIALRGHNTDVMGFYHSIESMVERGVDKALILGSGGAAKAVKHALEMLEVECVIVSRHKSATTVTYEELTRNMIQAHRIIVNATPVGMYPHVDECPDIPYRNLTHKHLCYDLLYNPEQTLFMQKAAAAGAQVKNGLEMLLLQAFLSYEIWTGEPSL